LAAFFVESVAGKAVISQDRPDFFLKIDGLLEVDCRLRESMSACANTEQENYPQESLGGWPSSGGGLAIHRTLLTVITKNVV